MAIRIDKDQIQTVTLSTPDGDTTETVVIPVVIPVSEVASELAEYDPQNGSEPYAAQAKPIARPVLDALKAYWER